MPWLDKISETNYFAVFLCLMLFLVGVLVGAGLDNSSLLDISDKIGSFVGGVSTLIALLFAVSTVSEWKKQKPHELMVEKLLDLEVALIEYKGLIKSSVSESSKINGQRYSSVIIAAIGLVDGLKEKSNNLLKLASYIRDDVIMERCDDFDTFLFLLEVDLNNSFSDRLYQTSKNDRIIALHEKIKSNDIKWQKSTCENIQDTLSKVNEVYSDLMKAINDKVKSL